MRSRRSYFSHNTGTGCINSNTALLQIQTSRSGTGTEYIKWGLTLSIELRRREDRGDESFEEVGCAERCRLPTVEASGEEFLKF